MIGIPCGCGHALCDALMEATTQRIAAYNATDGDCLPVCRVARAIYGLEALAQQTLSGEPMQNRWGEE